MQLSEFNALSADRAAELVGVWANVPGWVTAIVEGRPYPDLDALAVAARQAAAGWQADELDAALADHPRIGQRVETSGPRPRHRVGNRHRWPRPTMP